jgi:hypothetical protein
MPERPGQCPRAIHLNKQRLAHCNLILMVFSPFNQQPVPGIMGGRMQPPFSLEWVRSWEGWRMW